MINNWIKLKPCDPIATEKTAFKGRIELFTDVEGINESNIIDVLDSLVFEIYENYTQCKMLKNFEKGLQPIRNRQKKVRADINNKTVVNYATMIKEFKKNFIFGNPVTYAQRAADDIAQTQPVNGEIDHRTDKGVASLNEMAFEQSKGAKDLELAEEFCVCGVGYRLVTANPDDDVEKSVFRLTTLKSECTFVIKANNVYQDVVLGGTLIIKYKCVIKLGAYTKDTFYDIEGSFGKWEIKKTDENGLGFIPIIEYKYNQNLCGCFELVIPIINAINTVASDKVNSIAQFVQAILWLNNCKISEEQFDDLMVKGCLQTTDVSGEKKAAVEWLTSELNQSNSQTVIDFFVSAMLEIAGVPSRETSTGGNTGQAIMLSDGWTIAETQAQAFEEAFKYPEQQAIKAMLKIAKNSKSAPEEIKSLFLSDIDIKFNRDRTANLIIKTQALNNLLVAGVHPRIAFGLVSLFRDTQQAYLDSVPYLKKWEYEEEEHIHNDEENPDEDNTQEVNDDTV
jgi:SPP1 family phage portal protein